MDVPELSSPSLPLTSDPALCDNWEDYIDPRIQPSSSFSDEFEAIQQLKEETVIRKNKEGTVIQHRAWPLGATFRSEADYLDETPLKSRSHLLILPSSPPVTKMPSASSPVAYPPSSSPAPVKRRLPEKLSDLRHPKAVGGFLLDDSDEEHDASHREPAAKRRMLDGDRQPSFEGGISEGGQVQKPIRIGGFMMDDDECDDQSMPLAQRLLAESIAAEIPGEDDTLENLHREKSFGAATDALSLPSFANKLSDTNANELGLPSILTNDETTEPSLPFFLHKTSDSAHEPAATPLPAFLSKGFVKGSELLTCSGRKIVLPQRKREAALSFEQMVASRSTVKVGRARKNYYGIDIHSLIDEANNETTNDEARKEKIPEVMPSTEESANKSKRRTLMWTEKYRARSFMELVGDDRTHRQVLRWLKAWDPIVFPKSGKAKVPVSRRPGADLEEEKPHRKILLLTGPPGLGKTTLAHVCARQAGYEVMEINASDERSSNVVKGRIRTSVGTESVKNGATVTSRSGHVQKTARPLCVIVDEVDGVVGGAGASGEGGFIKALIDLIVLDQKNSSPVGTDSGYSRKKKKGDNFKMLRPLILICNDVYHPSLRPLRNSSFAEIIHVRKPPMDAVVTRMRSVFEKEGVSCDNDAVRRLCEATWGVSAAESRKGREGAGEGDLRGIMVVGEWAAGKLRASQQDGSARLTRKWVEENMMTDLNHGGGGSRGVGRGGTKEVVSRVFLEGAGFPKTTSTVMISASNEAPKTQLGVAELVKKAAMERLREMVDTSGDISRIVTDIFADYPNQPFNDDSILTKPDAAYEWLHFHDTCSSRVFTNQDFELATYLSQPVLACHHLFSSPSRHYFGGAHETKKWGEEEAEEEPLPFTGPRADYDAFEAEKLNRATILELQGNLNAMLLRSFRSPEDIATDLMPYLVRMLTPEIKPIIVGGSGDQRGIASVRKEGEKALVKKAVDVMGGVGVVFERGKLEGDFGNRATQWIYRMEPPLDTLVTFETASSSGSAPAPVRYAVRQVLDQEYQKSIIVRENEARQARYKAANPDDDTDYSFSDKKENAGHFAQDRMFEPKKDFFGRLVEHTGPPLREMDSNADMGKGARRKDGKGSKVWVSFHEGFSNAVRKPITIEELMRGL